MISETRKLGSVLLIDDDDTVNYLNTIIIRTTNLIEKITSVKSGESGLMELEKKENDSKWPEIILVDINMPRMNGWEFIEIFKEKFNNSIPKSLVCMLSSSLDPRDQKKVDQSDVVDLFVSKPLTIEIVSDLHKKYVESIG